MRVAVVGASGLAGLAVVEHLLREGIETIPLVGSTGNSWGLLSQGIVPRVVNVLNRNELSHALYGCTHVINCLRGDHNVMLQGVRNLVKEALHAGATRFVHLSSVSVYGHRPLSNAAVESAMPTVEKGSYGSIKLQQDKIVQRMASRGLQSIILCSPNIIGPGSYFLLQVLGCMLKDELLLADGGICVCNTLDVRNLAHACFLALSRGSMNGERYFVTDDERVTWADIVNGLRAAGQIVVSPPECTLDELRHMSEESTAPKPRLWVSVKHLVSSDVRNTLRRDPLLAKIDSALRAVIARLGPSVEEYLRLAIEGPIRNPHHSGDGKLGVMLSAQQLRGVWHRCDKAKAELGYRPIYTFSQSMAAFSRWLQGTRGMLESDWNFRKILFGYAGAEKRICASAYVPRSDVEKLQSRRI
jgi:nucleoside-diphosphate-sugar epimerase